MELLEGSSRVIGEPLGFGQKNLGLGQTLILLRNVLKEFSGLDQVSRGRLRAMNWLLSAMNQILLCKLEQKVSAQPDVEVDVALRCFGLCDVEIESLIQELDGLLLVLLLSPAEDGLEVCVV